jgi:hypothetical protein
MGTPKTVKTCRMRLRFLWTLRYVEGVEMLFLPTFNHTDLLCYLQDEVVFGVDQVSFYLEDLLLEAVPANL